MKSDWVPVPGFPEYEISPECRVRSVKRKKLLTAHSRGGYLYFSFQMNGKTTNRTAHRLLWEAFVGPIPAGMQLNHKDFNKKNNTFENLEVVTPEENRRHGARHPNVPAARSVVLSRGAVELRFPSITSATKRLGLRSGSVWQAFKKGCRVDGWRIKFA